MCLNVEQNTQEPGGGDVSGVSSIRSHRAGGKGFQKGGVWGLQVTLGTLEWPQRTPGRRRSSRGMSHPAEADAENIPGSASILLMSPTFSNTMKYKG